MSERTRIEKADILAHDMQLLDMLLQQNRRGEWLCHKQHNNEHKVKYCPDRHMVRCPACGATSDVFQIYADTHGLDNYRDFGRICDALSDMLGNPKCNQPIRVVRNVQPKHKQLTNHTADYSRWKNALRSDSRAKGAVELLHHRGIYDYNIERFNLGAYFWRSETYGYKSAELPEITFPVDEYSYVCWRPYRKDNDTAKYKSFGRQFLFGWKQAINYNTVWIVEGVFDALSFWECDSAAVCILGSAGIDHIQQYARRYRDKHYIICADSDDRGTEFCRSISDGFDRNGISYSTTTTGQYKDANEWLTTDREQFLDFVIETEKSTDCATNTADAKEIQP